jgi:hypothetical protein
MFVLIEAYLSSGLTQRSFSQKHSIPYSTFQWWLQKYRKVKGSTKNQKRFIPINLTSSKTLLNHPQYTCAIEYPNGVIIHLGEKIDTQLLLQLIQAQVG